MNEREWRERYEQTQYDDDDLDDANPPVPSEPDPDELGDEQDELPRPRRAHWHRPLAYEFPSGTEWNPGMA